MSHERAAASPDRVRRAATRIRTPTYAETTVSVSPAARAFM